MAAPLGAGGIAAVDPVEGVAVGQDLLLEVLLDGLLQAGVDVEHDGVADLGAVVLNVPTTLPLASTQRA